MLPLLATPKSQIKVLCSSAWAAERSCFLWCFCFVVKIPDVRVELKGDSIARSRKVWGLRFGIWCVGVWV